MAPSRAHPTHATAGIHAHPAPDRVSSLMLPQNHFAGASPTRTDGSPLHMRSFINDGGLERPRRADHERIRIAECRVDPLILGAHRQA